MAQPFPLSATVTTEWHTLSPSCFSSRLKPAGQHSHTHTAAHTHTHTHTYTTHTHITHTHTHNITCTHITHTHRGVFSERRYRRLPRAPLRGGRKKLRPAKKKKTRIMFLFCWTEFFCAPFYISNQYFDIKTKGVRTY